MKRIWFCGGMMIALLALSVALYFRPGQYYETLSRQMLQASEYAQVENWAQADTISRQCRQKFSETRAFCAAFSDHEPLERMEVLFAQLAVYLQQQETLSFATAALELSTLAREVSESFSLRWWTFL